MKLVTVECETRRLTGSDDDRLNVLSPPTRSRFRWWRRYIDSDLHLCLGHVVNGSLVSGLAMGRTRSGAKVDNYAYAGRIMLPILSDTALATAAAFGCRSVTWPVSVLDRRTVDHLRQDGWDCELEEATGYAVFRKAIRHA